MKTFTLCVYFLLVSTSIFAQAVHTVDNRQGTTAQFSSAQAAADAASPGDFIYLHPSETSYGPFVIRKTLHVRGNGHNPQLNNGEHAILDNISINRDTDASTDASNSTISGVEFSTINTSNIQNYSNISITNCRIRGTLSLLRALNYMIQGNIFFNGRIAFGQGQSGNMVINNIFNWTNPFGSSAMISRMISTDTFLNNIIIIDEDDDTIFSFCENPVVNNNIFVFGENTVVTGVTIENSTINFQNCLTFSYGSQTIDALTGAGNLDNINPQFADIGSPENPVFDYDNNYRISSGSPAENAGTDGFDLGVFGQGFLFQMQGYPFDLPYLTNITINNTATIQAGANLEVVIKGNANVEN